jgi:hypothetical protein
MIYTITEAQRQQLLASYDTSQSLSHDPLDHLTRIDGCWDMLQSLEPALAQHGECVFVRAVQTDGTATITYSPAAHKLRAGDKLYTHPAPQPTSADYAMGYAEGFNDACKPAPQPAPNIQNYLGKDNPQTDAEYQRMTSNGAAAWIGVDTQTLRTGVVPQPELSDADKTCGTCINYREDKQQGIKYYGEACYTCNQWYGSQWESA